MKPNSQQIAKMMKMILSTEEDHISCDDCYLELDKYVEMLQDGQEADEVLPHIKRHLEQCVCCLEEYDALRVMIAQLEEED